MRGAIYKHVVAAVEDVVLVAKSCISDNLGATHYSIVQLALLALKARGKGRVWDMRLDGYIVVLRDKLQ
jgi:hypothetical protein